MSDPFPQERVSALIHRLPAYARLTWNLGRDPMVSKARRGAVIAAAGYLISPIDLVPGIIPVLGQLDDLLVILVAVRLALAGLDPEQRARHLAAVGVDDTVLVEDVTTLGLSAAWLARSGARLAVRVSRTGLRLSAGVARTVTPVAPRGAQRTGQAVQGRIQRPASAVHPTRLDDGIPDGGG